MKKLKGFTLIEMVITIVVIITLSSISVPLYTGYKRQAIMSEGYILLGTIREAQKLYYGKYKTFLHWTRSSGTTESNGWTSNEEVLGIDARGNKYFTYFNVGYFGNSDIKYYFRAQVRPPKEAKVGEDLILEYNISLGQRFVYSSKRDNSWE